MFREVSAKEKIRVLEEARKYLRNPAYGSPSLRKAIAQSYKALGYFGAGVGSARELSTTIEIARALQLGGKVERVEEWEKSATHETLTKGIETTISHLQ